jgi:hypothetical protein
MSKDENSNVVEELISEYWNCCKQFYTRENGNPKEGRPKVVAEET